MVGYGYVMKMYFALKLTITSKQCIFVILRIFNVEMSLNIESVIGGCQGLDSEMAPEGPTKMTG